MEDFCLSVPILPIWPVMDEIFTYTKAKCDHVHFGFFHVLESGRGVFDGGMKSHVIYVLLRNITAADMMAALEAAVYQKKVCTLVELVNALSSNYEGCDWLLVQCRHAPKFGVDNNLADTHAVRLMAMLLDVLEQESINA